MGTWTLTVYSFAVEAEGTPVHLPMGQVTNLLKTHTTTAMLPMGQQMWSVYLNCDSGVSPVKEALSAMWQARTATSQEQPFECSGEHQSGVGGRLCWGRSRLCWGRRHSDWAVALSGERTWGMDGAVKEVIETRIVRHTGSILDPGSILECFLDVECLPAHS